jgi:thioredoxin-related protein
MYTSMMLLALAGSLTPAAEMTPAPQWVNDYGIAFRRGQKEQKPLAIFFGRGEAGWEQLTTDGALGKEAVRLLQSNYIPVYLDLSKDHARDLASTFRVKDGPALVISDRSGENVALRYTGTLESADLHRCLARYADPDRVVRSTDTDPRAESRDGSGGSPTYRVALAAARRSRKPMLLIFHAEWCTWCRKMERDTFADAGVRSAMARYEVYHVDTDLEPRMSNRFLDGQSGIPAYCVLDPKDEKVQKTGAAYKTPQEFLDWLE